MPFNDLLDFAPTLTKLQGETRSFHLILSGYLRSSKTFELYATLERLEGLESRLLPFELKGDSESIQETLSALFKHLRSDDNFRSIMVSDPFKRIVQPFVDEISDRAIDCGAVNVVIKEDGRIKGDNFDGKAFVTGVNAEYGIVFETKRVLFLGCGGVTSAIATELAGVLGGVGLVDLSVDNAETLKQIINRKNPEIAVEVFPAGTSRDFRDFDYLYNGTGLGKSDNKTPVFDKDLLKADGIAFDANYTPSSTRFLQQMSEKGFSTVNGLSHMMMCTALHLSAVTGQNVAYEIVKNAYREISAAAS